MHNVIYIELQNGVSAHGGSHPLFFFLCFTGKKCHVCKAVMKHLDSAWPFSRTCT